MSTNCIVLGQKEPPTHPKPIQFVKYMDNRQSGPYIDDTSVTPKFFKNIELIASGRTTAQEYDIMFAYDDDRSCGCLFLGFWNDGVVE